jgi:glycosyltransferase involved in cell wall biosynthesis
MKIMYATSMRVCKIKSKYYCASEAIPTLQRYLTKFGDLQLVCRVSHSENLPQRYVEIPSQIEVIGTKSYLGFLKKSSRVQIKSALNKSDFVMAHLPSVPTYLVTHYANQMKVKYCAVVVGCAWDAYFNYSLLGKILAPFNLFIMKKSVSKASYAIYVTDSFLQRRYPCDCKSISASNVFLDSLDEKVLEKRLEKIKTNKNEYVSLATTAAVDVKYKAQEDVIKAISNLKSKGLKLKYYLAGGGDQSYLKDIANKFDVSENVVFLGQLNKDEVIDLLDDIDIYIQPSKQEGLPRAVIEAMNRACPVLGSDTAGIPELIDSKFVFKRGSIKQICEKIQLIINEDIADVAIRNFKKSEKYLNSIIDKRRNDFFDYIIEDLKSGNRQG